MLSWFKKKGGGDGLKKWVGVKPTGLEDPSFGWWRQKRRKSPAPQGAAPCGQQGVGEMPGRLSLLIQVLLGKLGVQIASRTLLPQFCKVTDTNSFHRLCSNTF